MHMCVYIHTCIYTHKCVCVFVRKLALLFSWQVQQDAFSACAVYIYICIYTYMFTYIYLYLYICMYAYLYIYISTQTAIQINTCSYIDSSSSPDRFSRTPTPPVRRTDTFIGTGAMPQWDGRGRCALSRVRVYFKGALQLFSKRQGSNRFARVPERVLTKGFVCLIIGNSKSNHLGAQGTLNPQAVGLSRARPQDISLHVSIFFLTIHLSNRPSQDSHFYWNWSDAAVGWSRQVRSLALFLQRASRMHLRARAARALAPSIHLSINQYV